MNQEWSLKKSLIVLIGTTSFTLLLSIALYSAWKNYRNDRFKNEKYKISAIVQTGPEKEALKTAHLAELLDLSSDRPENLYAFDTKKGEAKLLACPLIRFAKIRRIPPSMLYVDYEVRKPVAYLGDFINTGVDEEGVLFPVSPFFSPKNLPEIYLGLEDTRVCQVRGEKFFLALEILHYLEKAPWEAGLRVLKIDTSKAAYSQLGQREVVLVTEEEVSLKNKSKEVICVFPKMIRISPKDYPAQLENFFQLQKTMMDDYRNQLAHLSEGGKFAPRIVDLRIPQLAFIQKD